MSIQQLVQMANDVGHFFATERERPAAVAGIANHLQLFWDPRMRRQIHQHLLEGGAGLEDIVREALAQLPP